MTSPAKLPEAVPVPVDQALLDEVSDVSTRMMERVARVIARGPRLPEMGMTQLRILSVLGRSGPQRMTSLARMIGLAVSSTSEHVSRMVKAGYLQKARSELDNRVVEVSLTVAGVSMNKRRRAARVGNFETLLLPLEEDDRERFRAALGTLDELLARTLPSDEGGAR